MLTTCLCEGSDKAGGRAGVRFPTLDLGLWLLSTQKEEGEVVETAHKPANTEGASPAGCGVLACVAGPSCVGIFRLPCECPHLAF